MAQNDVPNLDWGKVADSFLELLMKSPTAIVTLVLAFFLGYGISFLLFDYRNTTAKKSHYLFHLLIGLGYTATIFAAVNWDIITRELKVEHFEKRMPLTILVSFVVAFVLMMGISIYKEIKKPYA